MWYNELLKFLKFLEKHSIAKLQKPKSSLGYKYPTFRDHPLHPPELWIQSKQIDEGAEGLWRINDDLFDFSSFIDKHPGGKDWLELTKGTDITETFEVHHISTAPEKLLKSYFIRKANVPRNSPFTFEEDGFYKTLKKEVRKELKNIPQGAETKSKFIIDGFLFTCILTSLIAVKFGSYLAGIISSTCLALMAIAGHNFFHQRDNFRMYYFDLTFMSYRNWRVTHVLSHHIYTNTIYDWEISVLEPFMQYLPVKKNFFVRYGSWLYSPIVYTFIYLGAFLRTNIYDISVHGFVRWPTFIPLIHLGFLCLFGGQPIIRTILWYLLIVNISSFVFGVIGLNVAHHHPDLFHDGDNPRSLPKIDWGLHEIDAVMDRKETIGSHFLGLISFGDHTLHHLFPTLDHGKVIYLYPVLKKICADFGIKINVGSQLELISGQFRQLATIKPRMIPS